MAKTLCDWSKKDLERKPEKLSLLVTDARFYCRKCARSANTPKVLCKAAKLPVSFVNADYGDGWR